MAFNYLIIFIYLFIYLFFFSSYSFPALQVGKNMYFEETNYTQVFNFEVKEASTPNVSQFKKPASIEHPTKVSNVPKFTMDESTIEFAQSGIGKRDESSRQMIDQHATVDTQGAGLSVIMEATRESTRYVVV